MPKHLQTTDINDTTTSTTGLWSSDKTRQEIDAAIAGLAFKDSVRAATTTNITLTGTQTIDGVALAVGDRVLVKNQTTASQNGIYDVQSASWTRSVDCNTSAKIRGTATMVEEGTTQADQIWILSTDNITLGTTSLTFSRFALPVDVSGKADKIGTDDIEITDSAKGVILKSGNGTRWRLTMNNDGALQTTSL